MITSMPTSMSWRGRWRASRAWWWAKIFRLRKLIATVLGIICISRINLFLCLIMSSAIAVYCRVIIHSCRRIVYFISLVWNWLCTWCSSNVSVHAWAVVVAWKVARGSAVFDVLKGRLVWDVTGTLMPSGRGLDVIWNSAWWLPSRWCRDIVWSPRGLVSTLNIVWRSGW